MGVGTTRTMDRIAAAIGVLDGAKLSFEPADDIPNGGVLCALPALLALGLLRHAQSLFTLPKGFYPMESIFLLLAYLALGHIPSMEQLRGGRKHFIDTIRLIAYRAETALVQLARETLKRTDDGRSFVRGLMNATINLRPDPARGELRIELQGQANPIHDDVVAVLCTELNATETHYLGTELLLKYVPVWSPRFPGGQDV